VTFHEKQSKWRVQRWSKSKETNITNGCYGDEETAAHASDTLARELMENGEHGHKLNFPDDDTEVHWENYFSSKFIGVSLSKNELKWKVQRWSKHEKKMFYNGYHDDEEAAAHASDTLARKLMENGELKLKLNFPNENTQMNLKENQNKTKRQEKLSLQNN